eukprot:TRINITY_DN7683_c0_g1_i1.p1 TRINITY_DN7683_c0_g1~~TRINITY_DN7683_c0_g1_i1.p1  ORF type:complete len:108 (-),score=15.10 TRINITY_DN7683_c0_g1_i1:47-370(-)
MASNLDSLMNLNEQDEEDAIQHDVIHIRVQQRNGRKLLTTVQGIEDKFDKRKLVKCIRKTYACSGTVIRHSEYGEVMQFQGDQRAKVAEFLIQIEMCGRGLIKIHGF